MEKAKKILQKLPYILLGLIFILGIYLRTKVYLTNQSFWHDECALAWNILNKNYEELLQPLRFLQVAPPLFLIYSKIITKYLGTGELIFRLVPYIASLLSMVVFYFLGKTLFNTKKAILCAMFLFAINLPLYYYSAEFKPYSSDVMFCIFTIYLFRGFSKENLLLYSFFASIFIWFSFPTMFLITAILILIGFSKNYSLPEKIKVFFPIITSGILFYFYYFQKVFQSQKTGMTNYWNTQFINADNYVSIFQNANSFIFSPEVILSILMAIGLIVYLAEKNRFGLFAVLTVGLAIIASILKLYPFSGRLILFLIPIAILLCAKAVDIKHFTSYVILAVFLYGAYPQIQTTYNSIIKNNFHKNNATPREMAEYLKDNIKPNDTVFVNFESNSDYIYYKDIYLIKNKYLIESPQFFKKGEHVWFFLPNNPKRTYEKDIKNKYKIYYKNSNGNSALIYGVKTSL